MDMTKKYVIGLLIFIFFIYSSLGSLPARDHYPQIISHRGASGYVPEHSFAAYQLAIDLNTDYIEPDLVLSKDGIFIVMHDILLDETTNVASMGIYDDRVTTREVDGQNYTGYFVNDFTYDELMTLRLNQRLSQRTHLYDGLFQIPSFDDVMSFALAQYNNSGLMIGMYIELKHPSYFREYGYNMADMLLNTLEANGFDVKGENVQNNVTQVVPIVIQCFDADTLIYIKSQSDIPTMYLVKTEESFLWTITFIDELTIFADIIGPSKSLIGISPYSAGKTIVENYQNHGLAVHPWTFRADQDILPVFGTNFAAEEMYFIACLQVDALFSEFPDRTRQTIDAYNNVTSIWNQKGTTLVPHHLESVFNVSCRDI